MKAPRLRYSHECTEYRYPFPWHGALALQQDFPDLDARVTWEAGGLPRFHPWGLVISKNSRGAEELSQSKPSPWTGTAAALLFLQIGHQTQTCCLEMLARSLAHTHAYKRGLIQAEPSKSRHEKTEKKWKL